MTGIDITPFRNRLIKRYKHLGKWAKRLNILAWRVYDRDIPQFPCAVDIYGDYVAFHWFLKEEPNEDLVIDLCCDACAEIFAVPRDNIRLRLRMRQKGKNQYEKNSKKGNDIIISEGPCRFYVNLDNYLDTGIFLDHRPLRAKIYDMAAGKSFLNLFAYTATFSVYAALGGASRTESVDLSNTYLNIAYRNFLLNELDIDKNRLIEQDVFEYLDDARHDRKQFDIIFMDPPSFSNSKKMRGVLDVKKDAELLIDRACDLLAPDGVLFFSNNLKNFKLPDTVFERYRTRDISAQTIPEDFKNKRPHQCWEIRK